MLKAFGKKYGVKVQVTTFDYDGRRRTEAAHPRGQVRRLLPDHRCGRQARRRQAAAAAQQVLPAERLQRLGPVPRPVLRQGRAVHRPVHALHHRRPLPRRPGQVRSAANGYDLLWDPAYKGKTTCSTTTAKPSAWRCCATASPTSTPRTRRSRGRAAGPRGAHRPRQHQDRHRAVQQRSRGRRRSTRRGRATRSTRSTTCRRATGPEVLGYWYPARPPRCDRQRHDGGPDGGGAPGARTPLPRLHARPGQ